VGKKADTIAALKERNEYIMQENEHLRAQVEQLSRLQQPREFRMMPPSTINIATNIINEMGEAFFAKGSVGFEGDTMDKSVETAAKVAIRRWRDVVQNSRGNGMATQRGLSGTETQISCEKPRSEPEPTEDDGEQDAEMEVVDEEENGGAGFVDLSGVQTRISEGQGQGRAPEAPMGVTQRYINGGGDTSEVPMTGTESAHASMLGPRIAMGMTGMGEVDVPNGH
jgi:hypothetical protein